MAPVLEETILFPIWLMQSTLAFQSACTSHFNAKAVS